MHIGLMIIRLGLGITFMIHGGPKLLGGPAKWEQLGGAMGYLGINFLPTFWGFMAAFSEFFGAIFLILGLFFKPACGLLFMTMVVATLFHFGKGDGFIAASHPIELGIVFLGLFFIGPGKYCPYRKGI